MIAAIERENFVAIGVKSHHANGVLDSIGSAISEEDFVVMRTSACSDALCCLTSCLVCMLRCDSC